MTHTVEFLLRHGYALLFFWILAEQGALPLPSIPLVLASGALARSGRLNPWFILFWGLSACLLADSIWFQLGRRRGARILRQLCRIALQPDSCVRQAENAYIRYGNRAMLAAKFIPGLNAVAAPLAGTTGSSLGRFLMWDTLGAVLWIGFYGGLGYVFSEQLETVASYGLRMGSSLGLLLVGLLGAWLVWKFLQRRRFLRKLAVARITAGELRDLLESGEEVLIVDLRSNPEKQRDPMIGAVAASIEDLEASLRDVPRDREIILFCS